MYEAGPIAVFYGDAGAEVDLGTTLGGTRIDIKQNLKEIASDNYSEDPQDIIVVGETAVIKLKLAQVTMEKLALSLNRSAEGTTDDNMIIGDSIIGRSLKDNGKQLILKKYVDGTISTDDKDKLVFPLASIISNLNLEYKPKTQRTIPLEFVCFRKTVNAFWGTDTLNDKEVLFYIGDETDGEVV
jgi:hypothetical protein